jgi:hypothetical protein
VVKICNFGLAKPTLFYELLHVVMLSVVGLAVDSITMLAFDLITVAKRHRDHMVTCKPQDIYSL